MLLFDPPVAKFQVSRAFELSDKGAYVLAGIILEGEIRPGMWIDFTKGISWPMGPITEVELRKSDSRNEVWLIFKCGDLELAAWQLMAIDRDVMNIFGPPWGIGH